MMKYNPELHHRRSVRLRGYDYSRNGVYFITLCVQNRICLFGEIAVGADLCVCPVVRPAVYPVGDVEMKINDAGKLIEKWWCELKNKFPNIELDEYRVMPNHFHGIIFIDDKKTGQTHLKTGQTHRSASTNTKINKMVQWFKTMTTNEYIRNVKAKTAKSFDGKLWQRNYYEHIIRNENSLEKIREYIKNNPFNWEQDDCKL